ncbi:response regulator [Pseudomonas sp. NPDC007930]|uniref:response regulator n=1 Tax=Pseudomonas sp. NPDC007930 TaxID=3364417 RepID=UPI0036DFB42E
MAGAIFKETELLGGIHEARRVLVVEDEPIIREFVCELLAGEGYEAEACENADLAMASLLDHADRFNLMITDIRMPGSIDGAELTNRVLSQWPNIPVIVMSGHETPETAGIANQVAFLPKPWSIGQLIDSVNKVTCEPARH